MIALAGFASGSLLCVRWDADLWGPLRLAAEGRFLVARSTHDGDHLQRFKGSHAEVTAMGVALTAEPAIDLGRTIIGRSLVGISAALQYLGAKGGTLRQYYYADDPGLPGNQYGTPIPNTDFRIRVCAFVSSRFSRTNSETAEAKTFAGGSGAKV